MKTAVALLAAAVMAAPLAGQLTPSGGGTLASQQAALGILDRATAAHGGLALLDTSGFVRARYRIVTFMPGQEVQPWDTTPAPTTQPPLFVTVTSDPAQRTMLAEVFRSDTASQPMQRIVITPEDRFVLDIPNNAIIEVPEASIRKQFRTLPNLPAILLSAWSRVETLRALGPQTVAGRRCDAITYSDAIGTQATLCVDPETGLVMASETLAPDEPFGLGVQRTVFSGYRSDGGPTVPTATRNSLGGRTAADIGIVEVVTGVTLDSALLRRPEGAKVLPPPPGALGAPTSTGAIPVQEVAPGVFLLKDVTPGYNEMFVDMGDHVVVVEACGDPSVSERVLHTVTERLPGKPVRSVVLTHHHTDHSGGLWTYLARGITVITTAGNEAFVRSVAVAPRAVGGRRARGPDPRIEVVARRKTLGSGPNALEIIDVGPNPHAREILVAYLPGRQLLYVPDIYGYSPQFQPPEMLVSFADAVARLKLDVRTFVTAHTEPTTKAQYDAKVAEARGAAQRPGGR